MYEDTWTPPADNGAFSRNPATNSQLLPNRYRFLLLRAPNVEYTCDEIAIPGFSVNAANQPNPFVDIPLSGDHVAYEPLGIKFIVDSKFANYAEIARWLKDLGFPKSYDEYARLSKEPKALDRGIKSGIVVTVLDGQNVPKFKFTFVDAFPTALSGFTFTSTDDDLPRVYCHAEFRYTYFDVGPVT